MLSKLLNLIKSYQYSIFLGVCILLISLVSYNLGRISSVQKVPIKIGENALLKSDLKADIYEASDEKSTSTSVTPTATPKPLDMRVVVSKNSDKYHYSWCSTWKRIKPENQVWFNSDKEAEANGYTLAGNCTK